jgi:hypothetical protein
MVVWLIVQVTKVDYRWLIVTVFLAIAPIIDVRLIYLRNAVIARPGDAHRQQAN